MSESLSKEDKKQITEELYKIEEDRWKAAASAYFQPRGAPGRLSDGLLDAYHERNQTGIKHPQDLKRVLVKVMYDDRSYTVKNFLSKIAAENFVNAARERGLVAEIIVDDEYWAKFMGAF